MERKPMLIEIDESDSLVNSIPLPACPGCTMVKNEWPGEGYTHEGETYCCQGCAEGTGCMHATGAFRTALATIGFALVCVSFSRPVVLDHSATGACRFRSRFSKTTALRF